MLNIKTKYNELAAEILAKFEIEKRDITSKYQRDVALEKLKAAAEKAKAEGQGLQKELEAEAEAELKEKEDQLKAEQRARELKQAELKEGKTDAVLLAILEKLERQEITQLAAAGDTRNILELIEQHSDNNEMLDFIARAAGKNTDIVRRLSEIRSGSLPAEVEKLKNNLNYEKAHRTIIEKIKQAVDAAIYEIEQPHSVLNMS